MIGFNSIKAKPEDIEHIEALYEGRTLYFGDMHNHSASGGTSDGKRPLSHWKGALEALKMDFVAILDHRQVRHMYLPEWEDGLFVCGTEPGTRIVDCKAAVDGRNDMHYLMVFPSPKPLEELLSEFPEYEFEGGEEGHFRYPSFTRERFCVLVLSRTGKHSLTKRKYLYPKLVVLLCIIASHISVKDLDTRFVTMPIVERVC